MRRCVVVLVLVVASGPGAGCGKKPVEAGPAAPTAPPSPAAFAEDNPEATLAWLAAQQNALDAAPDRDGGEKFKALAETMKGRAIAWPGALAQANSNKTYGLVSWSLHTDPPEPPGGDRRERRYALVCKPFEPGVSIPDNAPFVRRWENGFRSGAGDWHRDARPDLPVRLTGTVAAVQVHRNSWVTGYGVQDRVVHTEVGVTLHIAGGAVAPVR